MQTPANATYHAGFRNVIWVFLSIMLLSGCAGPSLDDYRSGTPVLIPDQFFQGTLSARGVVKDWSVEVIRTFDASIEASWQADGTGTLDEVFRFDDGEVDTRVWTLTPENGGYRAQAGDVVEPGFMEWRGNAIHMNYVLEVPYGDDTIQVRMDDWMYLITPDTLINETAMSKWGINVGEVVLVIQRDSGRKTPGP